jgi:hypothetical protein
MNRIRAIWRRASLVAAAALGWLAVGGMALAQGKINNEELTKSAGPSKYVASYAIVLLGIGLGLLVVCNSARRRDRAKPEQYGE